MRELMQLFSEFSEWYDVVRTLSVQLDGRRYRIEIIHRFNRQLASVYDALLWVCAAKDEPLEDWEHLVRDVSFPWVAQDTPEGALHQALALLYERCRRAAAQSAEPA